MKKKYGFLAAATLAAGLLAACGNEEGKTTSSSDKQTTAEEKMIQDQLGRDVTILGDVDHVVVGGILPYFSTWFVATNSTKEIVGMHPNSYNAASNSMLAKMSPDVLKVSTDFIQNGELNVEELMNVDPQVYFEIANDTKSIEKLDEAGISTVALQTVEVADANPVETFNSWLKVTAEIKGGDALDRADKYVDNVTNVQKEIDTKLKNVEKEDKPRVLVLHQHSDKSIVVAGQNLWGEYWVNQTGGYDIVSGEGVQGQKEVNMEQIYKWNPDIIYITNFTETQPEDLFNNKISGQDWSDVKAVQDKKVYKIPLGIYRWFPPSGDAPLMLKWMANHNQPELFDYDMNDEIKTYYKDFYNFDVTDDEVETILHPSSEAAKQ
ncbi:ABC transporter substrate-binding protein [Kurthia sp. 3B1D]|uniref:ABC transporter substrate-binding protein n=1 Tax=Candidatus Kurthia intestinigallinarum TaxID=1562256 RepID=A0A433RXQ3_9BACL|nr:ABC transporter substrate-binding protein [Kurthia sp. 3B1D]RUS58086.1 ABC transporter substrate-binding protein [Kurthia sp. 3B1D]